VAALDTYTLSAARYDVFPQRARHAAVAIAIVLHAIAIVLLWHLEPVRSAVVDAAPLMVRLITPEPKEEVRPPDALPRPIPVRREVHRPKPVAPPPVVTAPIEAPSPSVAPAPQPVPPPPVESPPPVAAPAPEPASVASAPPAPAPPPEPIVPPVFNADYLNNPPPAYPAASRRTGEQGRVVLRVFVSEQGLPSEVQVRTSSGFNRLDEAASSTVRQWRFVPARRGSSPVGAWVLVPISFSLRS
jgi:periplasmic protein TonB